MLAKLLSSYTNEFFHKHLHYINSGEFHDFDHSNTNTSEYDYETYSICSNWDLGVGCLVIAWIFLIFPIGANSLVFVK